MFTGIIEEIGTVQNIKKGVKSAVLSIRAEKILDDIHVGDSIAVNGVCLTVISFSAKGFDADVMQLALMLQEMKNENVRKVALEQVKVLVKLNNGV